MRKEELVQKVHEELRLTRTQAEAMTVLVLREKLRAHRAEITRMENPLCSIPKGLEKMSRDQLIQECVARDIQEEVLNDGTGKVTRLKMIVAIRADVEKRQQNPSGKSQKATSSTAPAPKPRPTKAMDVKLPEDTDEEMSEWGRY